MTTTITKTSAIKAARRAVGDIIRRSSTDYVFFAPYNEADLSGPSTEIQAGTYAAARERRTQKVADVALALMGHGRSIVYVGEDGATVDQLVSCGIRQASAGYPRYCA